ncbi:MAG: HD domain-containing protein, partial [Deltaproteobacteria bacterium]|nr:HD domain-containing protein [Deltaproteobacteria bacterium]
MSVDLEQATEQLKLWTSQPSLLSHARALQIVMQKAAVKYGPGESAKERWGIAGLLHDADYERWPEEHPKKIVEWLKERGEEEIAHAIAAHNTRIGPQPESRLDKALLACDELAGFVIACSLVRPEGISTLESKSVRKKLKDKSFAAKVDREEIRHGAELLG